MHNQSLERLDPAARSRPLNDSVLTTTEQL